MYLNVDTACQQIAYYEYYTCENEHSVRFTSASGNIHDCDYYLYYPTDEELDETTPVVAYITHGGGMVEEERVLVLNCAAGEATNAIFVCPWTDRPDAVCAAIEDARRALNGKGDFDHVSGHGTSSGGRAIILTALESVNPDADYGFRFHSVCAYDPAQERAEADISGSGERMRRLAEQGTVLFIQTDTGGRRGSGGYCNEYAKLYSEAGGVAVVAEVATGESHEGKFVKPVSHNSVNWAVGRGLLREDFTYHNDWYYYQDGRKIKTSLEEATELLRPAG